jgi:hypothetical protein
MLLGGIGSLIVSGYLVNRLRTRLRHPFMSLIVGFPVFYSCLLASIWGSPEGYGADQVLAVRPVTNLAFRLSPVLRLRPATPAGLLPASLH